VVVAAAVRPSHPAASIVAATSCPCSYYAVVPLSLLPASWWQQQRWQQLPGLSPSSEAAAAVDAVHSIPQQLTALPGDLNSMQRVVSNQHG